MKTDLFNGYFWYQNKLFNDLPPDFFPSDYKPETYISILKELNGCFRLIVEGNDFLIAAVDRVRSLPLFFYQKGKDLFIDPDAFELKKLLNNPELDNLIFTEFLLTAHCCQNDTLYPEIKQLEAGQFLIWHKSEARLELMDYYIYQHLFEPIENPIEAMDEMHQHIIQR
jgi:asparagine synthase (glutamine-hydrolysing)